MARRVFFSFHYDDIWRVNQIRHSSLITRNPKAAGFIDKAEFESVERQGRKAIEAWIDRQLNGTSTTIVLIGAETASRHYVQYEIFKSYDRGNGLLGIQMHNMKDVKGRTQWFPGPNPFSKVEIKGGIFGTTSLANKLTIPIYDWVYDDGRSNIAKWIENAPKKLP